ncbi:MAG: XRE family transcriptional regulator [Bacteroidales bacterium]|nr:XRE family transcriptional regulator [Bacteroidales bacterium]
MEDKGTKTYNFKNVGKKIKTLLDLRKIDIDFLASKIDSNTLHKEEIEKIISGEIHPSLGPLLLISHALGVRLGTLTDNDKEFGPVIIKDYKDPEKVHSFTSRNNSTKDYLEFFPIAQNKMGRHMEPYIVEIGETPTNDYGFLSSHEGEEFIYVLEGVVEIQYDGEKEPIILKQGQSIYYDCISKHHVHGKDGQKAKILAVVYMPV